MNLRLLLLGAPAIENDGRVAALPFERRHQLLVYLALRRDWVARAELAALLWPDLPAAHAYTNLRKSLHRAQTQRWSAAIESEGTALRCLLPTDVATFEQALREGRQGRAAALRGAELLRGFDDAGNEAWTAWLSYERERVRIAWRGAALAALGATRDGLAHAEAAALSVRLLEADPLDEAALRAHLQVLAAGGQLAPARQAFRDYAARLKSELGLEPGRELA
ncbi:MAG: hypothetical protein KIT17_10360, partial [Rubrivivax sp.]|nr:hypothetical protein [Rubrivivax sp.]